MFIAQSRFGDLVAPLHWGFTGGDAALGTVAATGVASAAKPGAASPPPKNGLCFLLVPTLLH